MKLCIGMFGTCGKSKWRIMQLKKLKEFSLISTVVINLLKQSHNLFHNEEPNHEQGYSVYKLNKYDYIAARNIDEAIEWYQENWNNPIDYDNVQNMELNIDNTFNYIKDPDSHISTVSYRDLIKEAIQDDLEFPCVIGTYDW